MNADYLSALAAWRAGMEERLRGEYSWLALAGLFWLQEGDNPFGSAPENLIRLPSRAPAFAGIFEKQGSQVVLELAEGIKGKLNEQTDFPPVTALHDDHSEKPDYLFIGPALTPSPSPKGRGEQNDIRLLVIRRGDKLALRVWDPQHANRQNFAGRVWWAVDPAARVTARIERYDPPKAVMIDDVVGIQQPGSMDAALHFEWGGQPCSLDAELLEDGSYDLLFKDATAGKGSYPAGRFLTTEVAEGDFVTLDFNKAYSPPCAFTDFATCPLPQPQNILSVAIEAGERYKGKG
jgi:hypothetical protein